MIAKTVCQTDCPASGFRTFFFRLKWILFFLPTMICTCSTIPNTTRVWRIVFVWFPLKIFSTTNWCHWKIVGTKKHTFHESRHCWSLPFLPPLLLSNGNLEKAPLSTSTSTHFSTPFWPCREPIQGTTTDHRGHFSNGFSQQHAHWTETKHNVQPFFDQRDEIVKQFIRTDQI